MKTTIFTVLALSTSLLLLSCSDYNSEGDDYNPPYYTAENYTGIEKELKDAEFYCSSSSDCPKSVGLIFSNIDGSDYNPRVGQCTGFLIAEDIVATNSHCIPDRLKTSNSQCDAQIAIRFIDSSAKKNIFGCKEILDYSPLGVFDPDYAFFRVEKTGKEPFVIHKDGLKDNEPIRVAKVTPLRHSVGGRLEIENCKVGLGTLLNLKSTNSWSKTGTGLGCEAIGGNSGSPVLNNDGHVVGILQSKMLDRYNRFIEESFKKFKLEMPNRMLPHMLFTSLSCVSDPVTGTHNEQKCSYGEGLGFTDCIAFENDKTTANSERLYNGWKGQLPSIFVYEYETDEKTLTTRAQPICVKPKGKYADYDRYVSLEGLIGFREETLSLTYPHAITVGGRFNVDDEYRLEPELNFVEEVRSDYSVDLVKKEGKWTGTTNSTYSDWRIRFDLTKLKIPMNLTECTDEQISADEVSKVKLSNGDVLTEKEYERRQKSKEKKVCER